MLEEELLLTMRRIVRDFAPLLPGLRMEVVSPEAFRARLRGRPILPGEAREEPRHAAPPEVAGREGPRDQAREAVFPPYPLHAFPSTRLVMVDAEGVRTMIEKEDRRLQKVMVEGMILHEIIYLATSRQPLPDPRGRAEVILRRHWPFQYAAIRALASSRGEPTNPGASANRHGTIEPDQMDRGPEVLHGRQPARLFAPSPWMNAAPSIQPYCNNLATPFSSPPSIRSGFSCACPSMPLVLLSFRAQSL